ncbi:MAG: phage major capsid protein, partial [Ruminococcus sp.]|nr:phage major capsid protein [Ruminococcus sp.]
MTLNEIRQKRAEHWEMMKNFLDTHEDKNGNLNADDAATYANYEKVMDDFDKAVERAQNREQREQQMGQFANKPLTGGVGGNANTGKTGRASDEYNAAFTDYIKTKRASNILQESVSADGGYLVPTEFERVLYEARDQIDPIFELAGRITLGSLEKNVPYVASRGAAALIAEGGPYPVNSDQFNIVVFHAYKFGRIIQATDELIADSAFDMYTYCAESLGKANGEGQAPYLWTGTGTNEPEGVLTAAGVGVTAAATNAVTADEIIDLYYSLKEPYRRNAVWAMNDLTVAAIRKLKLPGTGEYLWTPGFGVAPDAILGRPLRTSENIPTLAANKPVIAFG